MGIPRVRGQPHRNAAAFGRSPSVSLLFITVVGKVLSCFLAGREAESLQVANS